MKMTNDFQSTDANDLERLFRPLSGKAFDATELQLSKGKIDDKINYSQPILRLYALRISEKTFIITGGAIKLCREMKDHPDTRDELTKLDKVRQWLIENDTTTQDDINYSYGEE